MKVRLTAPGWKHFTGNFGFRAEFKDGVSVTDLDPRQIARIGASTTLVNDETGEQVGPAVIAQMINAALAPVLPEMPRLNEVEKVNADERAKLIGDEKARKAAEAAALENAKAKAEEMVGEIVIYSRTELEAIGAHNGIKGLREIATPLGVKGTSITAMVNEILSAQASRAII